ncbi:MAG: GMC oxidoreductase, partial [Chloroflexota bacterium]|nr:GMC oxidoreductase [Chloroflexota bacterium]
SRFKEANHDKKGLGLYANLFLTWLTNIVVDNDRLGARTRPLDEIDFEKRGWVPYSGWPFDKTHLDPYYERAQSIFKLGAYTYDVDDWEDPEKTPRLPFRNDRVKTAIFQFGTRDTFINDHRDEITRADNISTYLYANAVELETNETAQTATRLRVACLGGNQFWVRARLFVLAMGAIETPRLLLLSNNVQSAGLGNQHDLVGRFFMEHPHLWSGVYIPSSPSLFDSTALYRIHTANGIPIQGKLTIAEDVLRQEQLLNYCVSIHPSTWPGRLKDQNHLSKEVGSPKALSAVRKWERFLDKYKFPKVEVFQLNTMSEQAPNPHSRVTLAAERDALGQNRVRLDWQLSALDIRSIVRAQEIIDEELGRAGLGCLHIELDGETPPPDLHGGWHHMGTTRMHVDPKQGVVDENCQVHGISNLFVAGPSVFPTGGYVNPVLNIIALVVRLADYVKEFMI